MWGPLEGVARGELQNNWSCFKEACQTSSDGPTAAGLMLCHSPSLELCEGGLLEPNIQWHYYNRGPSRVIWWHMGHV